MDLHNMEEHSTNYVWEITTKKSREEHFKTPVLHVLSHVHIIKSKLWVAIFCRWIHSKLSVSHTEHNKIRYIYLPAEAQSLMNGYDANKVCSVLLHNFTSIFFSSIFCFSMCEWQIPIFYHVLKEKHKNKVISYISQEEATCISSYAAFILKLR